MSTLKNKFESIYQKFVENRAYFQGKMKTWQQKGYEDAYQHGSRLLRDIEQNAQNIKQEMYFYDRISTHTARRTFITMMKRQGKSDKLIARIK